MDGRILDLAGREEASVNERVLITGGANGLGLALCRYFATRGAEVVVLDKEVPENLPAGTRVIDVDLKTFAEERLEELMDGPFDRVIVNAGISVSGDFTEIDFEKEREVFEINTLGHIRLLKFLLKNDLVRPGGRIAFICSASVVFPFPIALAYSASKSALDGFAHALEAYLVPRRISVSRVYPGPMRTRHTQYYPGSMAEGGRLPEQSVGAVARGIQARRRRIFPDPKSRLFHLVSKVAPGLLVRKAYEFYKDRLRTFRN